MRETPAAFRARTGRGYAPAAGLVPGARALADDEPCPTLFRYPGPEALFAALTRDAGSLAPPGAAALWLCDDPVAPARAAVSAFGSLAVLEPLRLSPARVAGTRAYVAVPAPVPGDGLIWVPPSRVVAGSAPWDGVRTLADARALLGPGWVDERTRVAADLADYLEELAELRRRGAPPPPGAWCDVAPAERARILAAHAVAPRWRPGA